MQSELSCWYPARGNLCFCNLIHSQCLLYIRCTSANFGSEKCFVEMSIFYPDTISCLIRVHAPIISLYVAPFMCLWMMFNNPVLFAKKHSPPFYITGLVLIGSCIQTWSAELLPRVLFWSYRNTFFQKSSNLAEMFVCKYYMCFVVAGQFVAYCSPHYCSAYCFQVSIASLFSS